jgi:hypothetical protein
MTLNPTFSIIFIAICIITGVTVAVIITTKSSPEATAPENVKKKSIVTETPSKKRRVVFRVPPSRHLPEASAPQMQPNGISPVFDAHPLPVAYEVPDDAAFNQPAVTAVPIHAIY